MIVNKELTELYEGLIFGIKNLSIDGKIIVITFHSLEDKLVKKVFDFFEHNINLLIKVARRIRTFKRREYFSTTRCFNR